MANLCAGYTSNHYWTLGKADSQAQTYSYYVFNTSQQSGTVSGSVTAQGSISSSSTTAIHGPCSFDPISGIFAIWITTGQQSYIQELSPNDSTSGLNSGSYVDTSSLSVSTNVLPISITRVTINNGLCYAVYFSGGGPSVICQNKSKYAVQSQNTWNYGTLFTVDDTSGTFGLLGQPSDPSQNAIIEYFQVSGTALTSISTNTLSFPVDDNAVITTYTQQANTPSAFLIYVSFESKNVYQITLPPVNSVSVVGSSSVAQNPSSLASGTSSTAAVYSTSSASSTSSAYPAASTSTGQGSTGDTSSSEMSSANGGAEVLGNSESSNRKQTNVPASSSTSGSATTTSAAVVLYPTAGSVDYAVYYKRLYKRDGSLNVTTSNSFPSDISSWNPPYGVFVDNPTEASSGNPNVVLVHQDGSNQYSLYQQPVNNLLTESFSSSPNLGAIIGGTIGGVIGLGLLIAFIILLRKRRRGLFSKINSPPPMEAYIPATEPIYSSSPIEYKSPTTMYDSPSTAVSPRTGPPLINEKLVDVLDLPTGSNDLLNLNPDKRGERDVIVANTIYHYEDNSPERMSFSVLRAAKRLSPDVHANASEVEPVTFSFYTEKDKQKFLRVVRALKAMSSTYITKYVDGYELSNPTPNLEGYKYFCVTAPLSNQRTLEGLLRQQGDSALVDVQDYYFKFLATSCVLRATNEVHAQGLVHTRLSASAFYYESVGTVVDLYLGQFDKTVRIGNSFNLPEARFVPPEYHHLIGSPKTELANTALDIWCVGCIIYSIATGGKIIFHDRNNLDDLQSVITEAIKEVESAGEGFAALLRGTLQIRPEDRVTAEELLKKFLSNDSTMTF